MDLNFDRLLDRIGRALLRVLQENARVSWRELGDTISLSAPAVAERVHKMEEAAIEVES
jgi:Lrp/AsnC family leucine-responsive transcriptional regulator